jgi:sterol desaturase/sphingolipid hydroxylase (fatty acid hydroxylase superfamily)
VGVRFRGIERVMVTPRYHHWHHSSEKAAIDTNFALHLTLVDRIFGTHHLPPGDSWPATYGLDGERLPDGYFRQFLHPFRPPRDEATSLAPNASGR